jgi:hypothetical protein
MIDHSEALAMLEYLHKLAVEDFELRPDDWLAKASLELIESDLATEKKSHAQERARERGKKRIKRRLRVQALGLLL